MQAGLLRDTISIERAEEVTNTVNGEQLRTWVQIWKGRAKVDFTPFITAMFCTKSFNSCFAKKL